MCFKQNKKLSSGGLVVFIDAVVLLVYVSDRFPSSVESLNLSHLIR